jgi:hypothetical protein
VQAGRVAAASLLKCYIDSIFNPDGVFGIHRAMGFSLTYYIGPALACCLSGKDLGIELRKARIAILNPNLATANLLQRARHAILL